jgi:hypothetical protein
MDDSETYNPTWRDDAELDALLLAAKMSGLAGLDGALDVQAGHGAIVTGSSLHRTAHRFTWPPRPPGRAAAPEAAPGACRCGRHWPHTGQR